MEDFESLLLKQGNEDHGGRETKKGKEEKKTGSGSVPACSPLPIGILLSTFHLFFLFVVVVYVKHDRRSQKVIKYNSNEQR